MAQFILILQEDPAEWADLSAEEMQAIIEEYRAWTTKLEAKGLWVGGNKLKDEGGLQIIGGDAEARVVDGPYTESKEVIGGYILIEADDYDQATAIAKDCPHLKYGLRIDLREIDPVHD